MQANGLAADACLVVKDLFFSAVKQAEVLAGGFALL